MTVDRSTLMHTGLITTTAQERTVARRWTGRVISDQPSPPTVAIGARPVTVGAHRDCDLVLVDDQVSRRHAELSLAPEGVRIKDLGSTNGTFWQASRVSEAVVPIGSTVRFGNTQVRFEGAETPALPPSDRTRFGGLVGASVASRELFAVLELAAPTDATVLLEGPSGTGKELAARAIHDHSERAAKPFVVVDCGAIPETLIDSHLFGHVRGAFTGAASERKGAFVEADGGTVFLDELGELPLSAQAKLLRVLEAGTVQAVGSDQRVTVDTRVVAATHRNLHDMVEQKQFRFDLFYRLAVVHVVIPSLAERIEDLPMLIGHFYEGRGIAPGPIVGDNLSSLSQHAWPGNVRELRNVLERAWALSGPKGATFADLKLWFRPTERAGGGGSVDISLPFKDAKEKWVDEFERIYLRQIFEANSGNISRASEAAGINRRHFRTLLRKHHIISS